jgi:prephenate dehydrogenase
VSVRFERIAVVGLGLLGGSVAWASRARGVADSVVGATRQQAARDEALAKGAVDAIVSLEEAARGADLIVLATPVHAMPQVLEGLRPGLGEGAIVTDVGSVKSPLHDVLPSLLPGGVHYVGSHPMAGSHESGMSVATPDLFVDAKCVVSAVDADALARVAAFWTSLGALVVEREPDAHDVEVAWTSHAPHLLAYAFAKAFEHAPEGASDLLGSGFRDFTRIAHSEPEMWADILGSNRKAVVAALEPIRESIDALVQCVESGDSEAIEAFLSDARARLQSLAAAESSDSATADPESNESNPSSSPSRGTTSTRRTKYAS